ncbi:KR domain-containing protein, partial [Bisporella sp. PMI_857]
LADLLVKHGAKHVAFLSRSGDTKDEIKIYLEKLPGKMTRASAYPCDITNREALKSTLRQISITMPEVKGFVHCAMLLKDSVFENMSHELWVAASGPKIQRSWKMHELLLNYLDFFVMLSSSTKGMNVTAIDLSAVAGMEHLAENAEHYDMRNPAMKMQIGEKEIHHIFLAVIAGNPHEKPVPSQITTGIVGGEVLRNLMDSAP